MKVSLLMFLSFFSFMFTFSKVVEKPLSIEYRDHKRDVYSFESLEIEISSGFSDRYYDFNLFVNDSLIRTFTCITDRFIGRCRILGVGRARIMLPHVDFNEGDFLLIEIEGEYTKIPLTKDYSNLIFDRDQAWRALYVTGYIEKDLE
jgi:hypothetical protein